MSETEKKKRGRPPMSEEERAKRNAEKAKKERERQKGIAERERERKRKTDYRARLTQFMDKRWRGNQKLHGMTPEEAAEEAYSREMMQDLMNIIEDYSLEYGEELPEEREKTREYCRWVRDVLRKKLKPSDWGYRMLFDTYRVPGRWFFDDYMSAMEFYREKNARFWWPRRKVLEEKHGIATQIQEFIDDPEAVFLGISMPPGAGKLLADDTPVLTADGWKKHGDLRVGDRVVGRGGEFVKVLRVFPKGVANRRVWFSDGTHVDCHAQHEWVVYDRSTRKERIVETDMLIPDVHTVYGPTDGEVIPVLRVSRIAPVPGNCIEVEGGVYRVGYTMKLTHNSTLIKFLLSYIAGRWPESANMYISYSVGMVKMMLDSVNGMLTDDAEYRANEIFPKTGKPTVSNEYFTVSYRRQGDFPTIGFVSLGGSVTGRTRANRFMVTDDLVKNAEEARSPERLDGLWADYTATLTTRQIGDSVKQIMLGTRWSVHDPLGRMGARHAGDPRYRFIAIPVEDEEGHSNFDYDHPDGYSDKKIEMIRESLDPVDYSCLYLQEGIEKEGLAFPYDSLEFYNGVLPEGPADRSCFVCDPAFGGGDSLAMPICKIYGDDAYVVDVVFDKRAKDVTEPEVARRIVKYKCGDGRFEANNGGDFYADDVDKMLKDKEWRCAITTKKAPTKMSKEARIEQYSVDIKRMKFLAPKLQSAEYKAFMAEVMAFSYTSVNKHDDAPDSLAMLAQYLTEKRKTVTVPEVMLRKYF